MHEPAILSINFVLQTIMILDSSELKPTASAADFPETHVGPPGDLHMSNLLQNNKR